MKARESAIADTLRIGVAADHAGFELKERIASSLRHEGFDVSDFGAHEYEPHDDYPDHVLPLARAVGELDRGIAICGRGVGLTIASNGIPGVRAAVVHDVYTARQGVEDDNLNLLCLGARVIGPAAAEEVARGFLKAQFSGDERHLRRLRKIEAVSPADPKSTAEPGNAEPTDDRFQTKIREAILRHPSLSSQRILVTVSEGVVTLQGQVQSYRRKVAAQETAMSFDECRGIVNELEVEPASDLSDKAVAEHVRAGLKAHADITEQTIVAAVTDGIVTLSGNVASHWESSLAEDVALGVQGVRKVTNLLLVDMPHQIEDEALCREIEDALSQSSELKFQNVRVAVTGEIAVLSGHVAEIWHKRIAEQIVRRFRVKRVHNELVVASGRVGG